MSSNIKFHYNRDKVLEAKMKILQENPGDINKFRYMAKFVESGVPYDYVVNCMNEEIEEKKIVEFDVLTSTISSPMNLYEDRLYQFIQNIDSYVLENGTSLLFFGYNSSGKTFTANHLLMLAIDRGLEGYYINFRDLYKLYLDSNYGDDTSKREMLDYVLGCQFLVVDELGKENTTENVIGALESIIKIRTSSNLPTVFVTNLLMDSPTEATILSRYGNSVWHALQEHYYFFMFSKNGEFRKKRRKGWFE